MVFLFVTTLVLTPLTSNYLAAASVNTGSDNTKNGYFKINYMSNTGETVSPPSTQSPPGLVPSPNMEDFNAFPANIDATTLTSNNESESLGWNPNGSADTFIIFDSKVDPNKSLVLINTLQDNNVTCSVDYLAKGFFEVHCDEPPSSGGELHYMVLNGIESSMLTMSSGNITERVQNITNAENITIPRALEQPSNLTSTNTNLTTVNNGTFTQGEPQSNTQTNTFQTNGTLTQGEPQNTPLLSNDNITNDNIS
jgi:hypothetical protein